jgi:hypothetical protein
MRQIQLSISILILNLKVGLGNIELIYSIIRYNSVIAGLPKESVAENFLAPD